jgi:hypothetical protein
LLDPAKTAIKNKRMALHFLWDILYPMFLFAVVISFVGIVITVADAVTNDKNAERAVFGAIAAIAESRCSRDKSEKLSASRVSVSGELPLPGRLESPDLLRRFANYYRSESGACQDIMAMVVDKKTWSSSNQTYGHPNILIRVHPIWNLENVLDALYIPYDKVLEARRERRISPSEENWEIEDKDKLLVFFRVDDFSTRIFIRDAPHSGMTCGSERRHKEHYIFDQINKNECPFTAHPISRDFTTGAFKLPPLSKVLESLGPLCPALENKCDKIAKPERCARFCGTLCRERCSKNAKVLAES